MTVLIDTNVLLDVIQQRQPHDAAASRVWKLVEEGAVAGFVSAISFNNIFYIARKQVGSARALDAIRLVRRVFQAVPLDEAIIDRAIATPTSDFEDAIQGAAAASISANYVVTRNTRDFTAMSVPAVTPEELLAVLQP